MKHVNLILTFWLTVCMLLTGCSTSKDGEKHNFSIGKGTFLLDGKPFVIKAAEIYTIPEFLPIIGNIVSKCVKHLA